jgi:hypothetical protein
MFSCHDLLVVIKEVVTGFAARDGLWTRSFANQADDNPAQQQGLLLGFFLCLTATPSRLDRFPTVKSPL